MSEFPRVPILQIFISSLFITELVHHINFIVKLNTLLDQFKKIFENKNNDSQMLNDSVLQFLDYETTLEYNKVPLSDRIYELFNEPLSAEWEEFKNIMESFKVKKTYTTESVLMGHPNTADGNFKNRRIIKNG